MATATRITKSFSLDKELLKQIERTKGAESTSGRVNTLLKLALEIERSQTLDLESANFFSSGAVSDRTPRKAFQRASVTSIKRD